MKVLLVDADPQGSALDWAASRTSDPLFPVAGLPRPSIHKELPGLAQGYEHVLIDGPPRVYEVARSAIMASDLVLIPVQPSPYDVWAAKEIVDLLQEAKVFKPDLKSAFVINRKIVNTAIGRDVREALAGLEVPILDADVSQRVGFAEAVASGQTVLDTDPNGNAAREVISLVRELVNLHEQESELRRPSDHRVAGG